MLLKYFSYEELRDLRLNVIQQHLAKLKLEEQRLLEQIEEDREIAGGWYQCPSTLLCTIVQSKFSCVVFGFEYEYEVEIIVLCCHSI